MIKVFNYGTLFLMYVAFKTYWSIRQCLVLEKRLAEALAKVSLATQSD